MERLTYEKSRRVWDRGKYPTKYTSRHTFQEVVAHLAAYENTDLEPERVQLIANVLREVGETYNCWFSYVADCVIENSHLNDLFQAKKEGMLSVFPPNDPLTLEELREMDGEPVWVIFYAAYMETAGMWALVSVEGYTKEVFLTNRLGGRSTYDKEVVNVKAIYRRKPEEGDSVGS